MAQPADDISGSDRFVSDIETLARCRPAARRGRALMRHAGPELRAAACAGSLTQAR